MQQEMFPGEYKTLVEGRKIENRYKKLNLFLETDTKIIRCRGRLGNLGEGEEATNPF